MKLSLATVAALALSASPVSADLGGADITGPSGRSTTGQSYNAECGLDRKSCTVSFVDEKLVVNGTDGILRSQFINVILQKVCKQRAILMPWGTSCFQNQLDWDFTITYRASDGTEKAALIAFRPRYLSTGATDRAQDFERDLQIWSKDVMRPIGPSIEVR